MLNGPARQVGQVHNIRSHRPQIGNAGNEGAPSQYECRAVSDSATLAQRYARGAV